eukprot:4247076-Pleurochrysis_carterae.AAC.1
MSAPVRVVIFKNQASITALKDAVTVIEKLHAIIESKNASNAFNNKQEPTAAMIAELRQLQAEIPILKSGGSTGVAGCGSQAYTANANKCGYTHDTGANKNRRIKPSTPRGLTSTTVGKRLFVACNLQHTGICFVKCP